MMAKRKALEIQDDTQKSARRQEAQVIGDYLVTHPGAWKNATAEDIAKLETEGGFPPGTFAGIRDIYSQGDIISMTPDGYDLSFMTRNQNTGVITFNKQKGYFSTNQSASSTTISAANAQLPSNSTEIFRAAQIEAVKTIQREYATLKDANERDSFKTNMVAYLMSVAASTGNDADFKLAQDFKTKVFGGASLETTLDTLNANVAGIQANQ
jgi:hypothetical protein